MSNIRNEGRSEQTRTHADFFNNFEPIFKRSDFDDLIDESIVRYSNSINSKLKLYKDNYLNCEWINSDTPYVIALGSYDQIQYGQEFIFSIIALLYGDYLNNTTLEMERLKYIIKPNTESKIPIGIFHDQKYEDISAIIFSCTLTIGKLTSLAISRGENIKHHQSVFNIRYTGKIPSYEVQIVSEENPEKLTDGLFVIHNPNAKNKITHELFDYENITQIIFNNDEDAYAIKSRKYPIATRIDQPTMANKKLIDSIVYELTVNYNQHLFL